MDIIQVTNPKFHPRTMRSILVTNARYDIQLANQMRTLDYHRKNFMAKSDHERKRLTGRMADMATSMEAIKAREEQERLEKERIEASIKERHDMNVDRSAADENAIQVMKKLIQAAMEQPEPEAKPDAKTDRSRADSPSVDGSESVKSKASTERRSAKPRTSKQKPTSALRRPSLVSSTTSLAGSESTETPSRKDVSTASRRRRQAKGLSATSTSDVTSANASSNSSERHAAKNAATTMKLTRQIRNVVSNIYGRENEETANVAAIVSRLQPLVKRANDRDGQPLTSLGDDTDGVTGAGSDVFQKLKNILSEKFADAATAEIEMEEKTAQKLKNREKKLWDKFGTFAATNHQPLYLQKRTKFTSRYWDFDAPIESNQTVTEKDWDELRYCRYLRQGLPKFCKEK